MACPMQSKSSSSLLLETVANLKPSDDDLLIRSYGLTTYAMVHLLNFVSSSGDVTLVCRSMATAHKSNPWYRFLMLCCWDPHRAKRTCELHHGSQEDVDACRAFHPKRCAATYDNYTGVAKTRYSQFSLKYQCDMGITCQRKNCSKFHLHQIIQPFENTTGSTNLADWSVKPGVLSHYRKLNIFQRVVLCTLLLGEPYYGTVSHMLWKHFGQSLDVVTQMFSWLSKLIQSHMRRNEILIEEEFVRLLQDKARSIHWRGSLYKRLQLKGLFQYNSTAFLVNVYVKFVSKSENKAIYENAMTKQQLAYYNTYANLVQVLEKNKYMLRHITTTFQMLKATGTATTLSWPMQQAQNTIKGALYSGHMSVFIPSAAPYVVDPHNHNYDVDFDTGFHNFNQTIKLNISNPIKSIIAYVEYLSQFTKNPLDYKSAVSIEVQFRDYVSYVIHELCAAIDNTLFLAGKYYPGRKISELEHAGTMSLMTAANVSLI